MEATAEQTEPVAPAKSLSPWKTVGIVGVLAMLFATMSFTAVLGKSATYDETLHSVGGMVHRYRGDFRINPEDPALFGWWASLPHSSDAIPLHNPDAEPYFDAAAGQVAYQWYYVVGTLYANGGAAADQFLNTSRFMFILVGIALAVLIALWAYQLAGPTGGPWAAIAAATLFCLDPNFMGHAALVKNDVPLALLMCGLSYSLWRFGKSGGWYWMLIAAAACGMALNVKFSAVLFGPMFVIILLGRAMMRQPWEFVRLQLDTRWKRFCLVTVAAVLALGVSWAVTWAVYGFRYNATGDGTPLSSDKFVITSVANVIRADREKRGLPILDPHELEALTRERLPADVTGHWRDGNYARPVKIDIWLQDHHVLPEGWLFGFLYTYVTTLIRSAYLLGSTRLIGWWYYFPLTMLFKTPTATLLAAVTVPVAVLICRLRSRKNSAAETSEDCHDCAWATFAFAVAPVIYFGAALTTNLNLGLRHILPVYPFIFIALGVGFAWLVRRCKLATLLVGGSLALGLFVETVAAYPNYLAFFNLPSGGSRGGIRLLGDSNLDWGQDLPALASWQKRHLDTPLYFAYFGTARPDAYGINYENMVGGYPFSPPRADISRPGVLAVSATNVQAIYWDPHYVEAYVNVLDPEAAKSLGTMPPGKAREQTFAEALRHIEPMDVLNGTIYLYEVPPKPKK